jgi:hypothetical protein
MIHNSAAVRICGAIVDYTEVPVAKHLHMGYFATKESHLRVAVWPLWFLGMVAALGQSSTGMPVHHAQGVGRCGWLPARPVASSTGNLVAGTGVLA